MLWRHCPDWCAILKQSMGFCNPSGFFRELWGHDWVKLRMYSCSCQYRSVDDGSLVFSVQTIPCFAAIYVIRVGYTGVVLKERCQSAVSSENGEQGSLTWQFLICTGKKHQENLIHLFLVLSGSHGSNNNFPEPVTVKDEKEARLKVCWVCCVT